MTAHSAPHQWRASAARDPKERTRFPGESFGFRLQFMRSLDRRSRGRPPAPAGLAPHSWSGFSTGEWESVKR